MSGEELYSEATDGLPTPLAEVLDDVSRFLQRYVVFGSDAQPVAVALWTSTTYVMDAFDVAPYLDVSSAEKRSGKTRLLEILSLLVRNPWRVVTPSEAIVYRKIDADHPTLLLDERDAIFRDRNGTYEGLRALLNAGNWRGTKVPRCVGKDMKLVDFDVFCPKAFAGIGQSPDTIADRSVPIRLPRRAPGETVERFRRRDAEAEAEEIRARLEAWSSNVVPTLRLARPTVPEYLNDRAADVWEPLQAVAAAASPTWAHMARVAAAALFSDHAADDLSLGVQLLGDIREVFAARGERVTTMELVEALRDTEGPWAEEFARVSDPRAAGHRIRKRLRDYEVRPRDLRTADGVRKGYVLEDFTDLFDRYLEAPSRLAGRKERDNATSQVDGQIQGSGSIEAERPKTGADQQRSDVALILPQEGDDELETTEALAFLRLQRVVDELRQEAAGGS